MCEQIVNGGLDVYLTTDQKVWGSNPYGCTIYKMFSHKALR